MLEKIRKIGENTYKVIAYIAIIAVILLINYDHIIMTDNRLRTLKIILWSIIGISLMVAFNKLVVNKLKEKNLWKITLAGLGIFLVLEIISTIYFKVEYNWDFKWLMESALEFAQTGKIEDIYYFKRFPNNIGALLIVTTAMKLFNTNDSNVEFNNIVYGANNYNYGLNSKKTYLELKATPYKIGSYISIDNIKILNKMYIWLYNNSSNKNILKLPLDWNFYGTPKDEETILNKNTYLLCLL